jgi:hypothetical protein
VRPPRASRCRRTVAAQGDPSRRPRAFGRGACGDARKLRVSSLFHADVGNSPDQNLLTQFITNTLHQSSVVAMILVTITTALGHAKPECFTSVLLVHAHLVLENHGDMGILGRFLCWACVPLDCRVWVVSKITSFSMESKQRKRLVVRE